MIKIGIAGSSGNQDNDSEQDLEHGGDQLRLENALNPLPPELKNGFKGIDPATLAPSSMLH
jgi:hypothetical protein